MYKLQEQASSLSTEDETETDDGDLDEDETGKMPVPQKKGFTLIFDVVRRFAQPLGIRLPDWEGRIIETKKGVVRLLSVAERAQLLFGIDGAQAVAAQLEQAATNQRLQRTLFSEFETGAALEVRRPGEGRKKKQVEQASGLWDLQATGKMPMPTGKMPVSQATTLDRIHTAMLLQSAGQANALRTLLKTEQERGPDFLRLANALSALYPRGSEEKRLLDAMLLAVPR